MHATRFSAGSLLVSFTGVLAGCGYHSTYVPPNDGRARLVWTGTGVAEHLPDADGACVATLEKLRDGEAQSALDLRPRSRWWHPEDEEPPADPEPEPNAAQEWNGDVDPGGGDSSSTASRGRSRHHGHHARGHGARSGGGRAAARASTGSRGGRTFATPRIGRSGHSSGGKSGGGSSGGGGRSGGGGGGGKGAGAAVVALIVVLYAVMPVAAIVWAESTPESSGVGASIDAVHAYNDLARSGAADCGGEP